MIKIFNTNQFNLVQTSIIFNNPTIFFLTIRKKLFTLIKLTVDRPNLGFQCIHHLLMDWSQALVTVSQILAHLHIHRMLVNWDMLQ